MEREKKIPVEESYHPPNKDLYIPKAPPPDQTPPPAKDKK
jgi:hypothetical protein